MQYQKRVKKQSSTEFDLFCQFSTHITSEVDNILIFQISCIVFYRGNIAYSITILLRQGCVCMWIVYASACVSVNIFIRSYDTLNDLKKCSVTQCYIGHCYAKISQW